MFSTNVAYRKLLILVYNTLCGAKEGEVGSFVFREPRDFTLTFDESGGYIVRVKMYLYCDAM